MQNDESNRNITERVTIAGRDLIAFVKNAVAEGNVRRLVVRKADGTPLMDIPLTAGVAVGGVFTLIAPFLTALGAIAALFGKVQVDVQRKVEPREERPISGD
ncbi:MULTISPECIES: DUF4342 domain-containing protein [Thiorhodovibrio]|jgi:hypothetical protein|uniref:DUF4342 domain-containing protein n=1 Tax=Thiorhodovibrio TaxID=61593 RepID=UPI00191487DD|nr:MULTISPECIES: DUF4342 domain-containing protein [Thiorhodovibrio]MBK5969897.1 hypothetical protein [Thiorhodovibrio winogradskyi]WPL12058.1 hypothetical protein Thiosp_01813 [Thiorhodovibrio litoralis]